VQALGLETASVPISRRGTGKLSSLARRRISAWMKYPAARACRSGAPAMPARSTGDRASG